MEIFTVDVLATDAAVASGPSGEKVGAASPGSVFRALGSPLAPVALAVLLLNVLWIGLVLTH